MFQDLENQLQIKPQKNLMQDLSKEKMIFGKQEKTNGGPEKNEEENNIAITPIKRKRGRPRKLKENMVFDKLDKKNCGNEKDEKENKNDINKGHNKRGRKRKEESKNIAITQPPKKRGRKPNKFKSSDLIDDEKTKIESKEETVLKNTMDESVLDGKRNQKIDPKKDEKVVVVAKEKDNRQILGQRKELFVTSKEKVPKKQNIDKKSTKSKSPKSPTGRTQFRSKKKSYEKYWCINCRLWISGGKASVTNHLRTVHNFEDCEVIMIRNQGMLKVEKKDFIPAEKETKVDKANDIEKKVRFPNKEEPQLYESEKDNTETLQSKYKFLNDLRNYKKQVQHKLYKKKIEHKLEKLRNKKYEAEKSTNEPIFEDGKGTDVILEKNKFPTVPLLTVYDLELLATIKQLIDGQGDIEHYLNYLRNYRKEIEHKLEKERNKKAEAEKSTNNKIFEDGKETGILLEKNKLHTEQDEPLFPVYDLDGKETDIILEKRTFSY